MFVFLHMGPFKILPFSSLRFGNLLRLSSLKIWPSGMKMPRFQTFWMNNKPLDKNRKVTRPKGRKWHFTPCLIFKETNTMNKYV
ncbi:hypothetical protein Hanom_Chr04g00286971 [Helianthus anomalus]